MEYFFTSTLNISEEGIQPLLIGWEGNSHPTFITLNKTSLTDSEIVVFNSSQIIDYFRRNEIELPKSIIDIFQIYKLVKGKPFKYHKYSEAQIIWLVFRELIDNDEELKSVISALDSSTKKIVSHQLENKLLLFTSYLRKAYEYYMLELKNKGELERYEKIEKPFNYILCKRHYTGMFLNQRTLHRKIEAVTKELNILNKRLRYEYNIFNPQNTAEIKSALSKNKFSYLSKMSKSVNKNSFWNFIKTGSEQNEFLNLLYSAYRISFDKNSLTKIIVEDDGKVYPVFDCSGTVTSRTLVRMPHIQQLKKTSRDIFSAKPSYTLLYADYSQFEPGILASLSDDENLISCYNQEDLYTSLSIELFSQPDLRPICKVIFLSFMYGMSSTGLENLIKDFFHDKNNGRKDELQNFFEKFVNLVPYKLHLETIALNEKKISSSLGNYRYFDSKSGKHLPSKVKRWVLSQKIQGTASLILKTAILNCCKDTDVEFLVPMHDAALFQVPIESLEEKKEFIKREFESAMTMYCPKLIPKVTFKKFTE